MPASHVSLHRFACVLCFLASARTGTAQSPPPSPPVANPARPTVSTPATLTPVGYLQFETGVFGAADSPEFSSQTSMNEVIKLSVAGRIEFLVSAEPLAHSNAEGSTSNLAGDVSVGAQGILLPGEGTRPTIAMSYLHRVHDGEAPDIDFGTPTNSLILLASADVKGFHYDANALFNEVASGGVRRPQFGQTLSISHPIGGRFVIAGEIWHFTQPFLRSNAVGNLWAVSYAPRHTLVLDIGFDHGLTLTSTQWEAFAGFTYLLPHRLW
jgi:hypothetical protein